MTRPSGFTLLELMVAIVLTSVVTLIAYGTARAGLDTNARLERYRSTAEARIIARALLFDALRHPPQGGGAAMNDVLFALVDSADTAGLPSDRVRFLSRGVVPPLGASLTWAVTLTPSPEGVRVLAVPLEDSAAAPLAILLASTPGVSVRVLGRTDDVAWRDGWDALGRVPAAVAIEFLSEGGLPSGPPLVVYAALEEVP